MIFEKDSRICFCINFDLKNYEDFQINLFKIIKNIDVKVKISKKNKGPFKISTLIPFNLMIKRFDLRIIDIKIFEDNTNKMKQILLEKLEKEKNEENKERIKKDIIYLENDLKRGKEKLKNPKGIFRLELRTIDKTDESQIKETFEITPENKILTLIEKESDEEFEFNLCSLILIDKNISSFRHGFELKRELIFSKEIMERIGSANITEIGLELKDSPLGIEKLTFGEGEKNISLDIEMTYKTKNISNIMEKINVYFDLIKTFFVEG